MLNKLFKKDELKILWPFYLANFLLGLSIIIMPFLVIYFRDLGFSLYEISMMTSAMMIGLLIFEIPTGAFADNYSRKKSIILGFFIYGIIMIFIAFIYDLYLLISLWFIAGIAATFISGADEALVIDNLNYLKRNNLKKEFFVKVQALRGVGLVISPFIGSFIVKTYSMKLIWIISGISLLIIGMIFIFMREHYVPKKRQFIASMKDSFKTSIIGLKFTFTNNELLIFVLGSLFLSLMVISQNGWRPLFIDLSMPEYSLGLVYGVVGFFTIISSILSKYLNTKIRILIPIIVFMKIILLFSLLLVFRPFFLGAALIFVVYFGILDTITMPSLMTYFHKIAKKKIRATLVSVRSMLTSFFVAILSIFAGFMMDNIGIKITIVLTGLFGLVAIFLFLRVKD